MEDDEILRVTSATDLTSPTLPTAIYRKGEERRILKNILVISVSFTLLFTSYLGMSYLQSSLNQTDGLGNWSSAVVSASLVVSALFVPTALIRKVGCKTAIFLSMLGYSAYIAGQFYPRFYTLMPVSVLCGLGAAPLWAACSLYLIHVSEVYAQLTKTDKEVITVRFFGYFYTIYQANAIFGNLISSTILSSSIGENDDSANSSSHLDPSLCGANFCPSTVLPSSNVTQNESKIYALAGTYLGVAMAACLVTLFFLDSLQRYGEVPREGSTKKLVLATLNQMRRPYQLLLIPLAVYGGMAQVFMGADFTAAFVSCAWGVEKIGYVLICYGLVDSLSCLGIAYVVRWLGRNVVIAFGASLNIALTITLLYWRPNSEDTIYFFVYAGFWGMADAMWQCTMSAYYGVLFPNDKEAAFSNSRLWESIGYVIAFTTSNTICVHDKLYVILGTLGLALVGYSTVQFSEWKRLKRSRIENKD